MLNQSEMEKEAKKLLTPGVKNGILLTLVDTSTIEMVRIIEPMVRKLNQLV